MTLISLLIALAIQRYTKVWPAIRDIEWFGPYMNLLKGWFGKQSFWGDWLGLVIVVAPVLIIVWILQCVFASFWLGLLGLLFAIFVLLHTMDGSERKVRGEQTRAKTENLFAQSLTQLFSIMFWFAVLGAIGAATYFTFALLSTRKEGKVFAKQVELVLRVADWVPARFVMLSFALMGHFVSGFGFFLKKLFAGLKSSIKNVIEAGLLALGLLSRKESAKEEFHEAMLLIDRALIVWLVVIAIVTVVGWVA